MRTLSLPLLVLMSLALCGACRRPVPEPPTTAAHVPRGGVVILKRAIPPQPEYAKSGMGSLDVVFRSAEQPTINVRPFRVSIQRGSDTRLMRYTDSLGVMHFDSLPPGRYRLNVLGVSLDLTAPVMAGCRTDVEVYHGPRIADMATPPDIRDRAVITTCPEWDR